MLLKFIGQDKSMGLTKGQTYTVRIVSGRNCIWVIWGEGKSCPYSSPQSFSENWSKP